MAIGVTDVKRVIMLQVNLIWAVALDMKYIYCKWFSEIKLIRVELYNVILF